nr:MAG TPA: PetM family of cytochrome b6f complex subunit 7 [Caudoviricetes sp.]DAQ07940.1 MAG TPA: PetM family of cytochrome b6f complex subunit 7 [Caudoviricetes sp.]
MIEIIIIFVCLFLGYFLFKKKGDSLFYKD